MWDVTDTEVKTLCTLTISTHTSRVRCDDDSFKVATSDDAFLLTHPVWDVTYLTLYSLHYHLFLLTHPVWDVTSSKESNHSFSIFLLTHPVWDVTRYFFSTFFTFNISTHTSRVGCDKRRLRTWRI